MVTQIHQRRRIRCGCQIDLQRRPLDKAVSAGGRHRSGKPHGAVGVGEAERDRAGGAFEDPPVSGSVAVPAAMEHVAPVLIGV